MDKQKSDQSLIETTQMPSPEEYFREDVLVDSGKLPSPEELMASLEAEAREEMLADFVQRQDSQKRMRYSAERNYEIALTAAGRHQANAERLEEELEALTYHDRCREVGYKFSMQELGRIEAQRDEFAYQLRRAQEQLDAREFKKVFSEELLKEFYATIEENLALESKNAELSADKSMLETRLGEETNKREEEKLVILCFAIAERRADNRAEAAEQQLKAYKERFGDVDKPLPLPRPGYFARLYGVIVRHCKSMEKLVYKREEK